MAFRLKCRGFHSLMIDLTNMFLGSEWNSFEELTAIGSPIVKSENVESDEGRSHNALAMAYGRS